MSASVEQCLFVYWSVVAVAAGRVLLVVAVQRTMNERDVYQMDNNLQEI